MSKARRLSSIAALSTAASLAFAGTAFADQGAAYQDDPDSIQTQYSIDNNLDNLFRVAGPDRVSTSIKLMDSTTKWNTAAKADRAIIATSEDFADALSAGPLADVYDAPILLSKPGASIDSRVVTRLKQKGFNRVTLIGGTGVFNESARAQLEAAGLTVDRQRGINRYETAVGIAKRTADFAYNSGTTRRTVNIYLATGVDFADAIASGAAAADNDGVVLLTKDKTVEEFTYNFLTKERDRLPAWANGIEIHTVGGQAEAAAHNAGLEDVRDTNTGKDRYETAALLFGKFKNPIEKVAVVSGEGFADGVAAAGFVANHDGALLLTRNNSLPAITKATLATVADSDVDVVVVGGTGSVSRAVSDQIANELYTW